MVVLGAMSCGEDGSTEVAGPAAVQQSAVERRAIAAFETDGVPESHRVFAIYRHADVMEPDAEVRGPGFELLAASPGRTSLSWVDLAPYSMFGHPGLLVFTNPDTGDVLSEVRVDTWPARVGGQTWDPWSEPPQLAAPEWETFQLEPGVSGTAQRIDVSATDSSSCEPRRYGLAIWNAPLRTDDSARIDADIGTVEAFWSTLGVAPEYRYQHRIASDAAAPWDDLRAAVDELGWTPRCCDELILIYSGRIARVDRTLWLSAEARLKGGELARWLDGRGFGAVLAVVDGSRSASTADAMITALLSPNAPLPRGRMSLAVLHTTGKAEHDTAHFDTSGSIGLRHLNERLPAMGDASFDSLLATIDGALAEWTIELATPDGLQATQRAGLRRYNAPEGACECIAADDCVERECQTQTCGQGSCAYGPVADGLLCASEPCQERRCSLGECTDVTELSGACNDGNACTESDQCSGGACEGTPKSCSDDDPCTDDTCNDGECSNPAKREGASCELEHPCADAASCLAGQCSPSEFNADRCLEELSPLQQACTNATCEANGCVFAVSAAACEFDDAPGACISDPMAGSGDGPLGVCVSAECLPETNVTLPSGGGFDPTDDSLAPLPSWMDATAATLDFGNGVPGCGFGLTLELAGPPTDAAAGTQIAVYYYAGAGAGQPTGHASLAGATHRLVLALTGDTWTASTGQWNSEQSMWEDTTDGVEGDLTGSTVTLTGQPTGLTGCSPTKIIIRTTSESNEIWKLIGHDGQDPVSAPDAQPLPCLLVSE